MNQRSVYCFICSLFIGNCVDCFLNRGETGFTYKNKHGVMYIGESKIANKATITRKEVDGTEAVGKFADELVKHEIMYINGDRNDEVIIDKVVPGNEGTLIEYHKEKK